MKRMLMMLLTVAVMLCCAAQAEGEYLYIEGEDGLYICGYTGSENVLRLPAEIDGKAVVGVAKGAFSGNPVITEVHIPDGYITIEESAFNGCSALRDVFIGTTIKNIEARAFANCRSLLGLSLATRDYSAHATAFEGSNERAIAQLDREALWAEWTGEDYDALYIAGVELMSRGEYEKAQQVFLSLYGYELSADYYFYSSARAYESRGEIDKAVALYALMPDLNDCAARLAYYNGTAEVDAFFTGPDYIEHYNSLFGEGGMFAGMLGTAFPDPADYIEETPAPAEQEPVSTPEASGSGSTAPVGGALTEGNAGQPQESEVTAEPAPESAGSGSTAPIGSKLGIDNAEQPQETEATVEPGYVDVQETEEPRPSVSEALVPYHEYSGDMPYEYDNYSESEGYYAMYYFYDDLETVLGYIALFEEEGWLVYSESMEYWNTVYISSPDQSCYFYLSYDDSQKLMILMYESGMNYGFDPAAGL